ncbi:MAG: DUF58 domain-containing protein [Verrucomicrobiota bacterium]
MKARHVTSLKFNGVGVAFLVIVALTLAAAVRENNTFALLLASLMAGLFLVTFIRGFLTIAPIRLIRLEFDNTFAGEPVRLRGTLNSRFLASDVPLDFEVKTSADCSEFHLPGLGVSSGFTRPLPPQKRGRLRIDSIHISSCYPLGLLTWSIRFEELATAGLIYPAPIDYLVQPDQENEEARSSAIGDFDELQTWQNGDSLSGICWKTFAKTGKRMRRAFLDAEAESSSVMESMREEPTLLDGDSLPALAEEELRSQLCHWIIEKTKRQLPYGLRFRGRVIETGSGSQHDSRCLETLTVG